jgi:hypothetical protein
MFKYPKQMLTGLIHTHLQLVSFYLTIKVLIRYFSGGIYPSSRLSDRQPGNKGIIATGGGILLWLLSGSLLFLAPFPLTAGVLLTIAGIITILAGTVLAALKKMRD